MQEDLGHKKKTQKSRCTILAAKRLDIYIGGLQNRLVYNLIKNKIRHKNQVPPNSYFWGNELEIGLEQMQVVLLKSTLWQDVDRCGVTQTSALLRVKITG